MKEKDFDQLIAAAFGELRAEEVTRLEGELDAAGRAELEAFRRLQGSLNAMPTPGPCQVSPEMLRDRILSEGVRSRPLFLTWLPRIATTGIAAALGLFLLNNLNQDSKATEPVAKPTQVATATGPKQGTILEAGPKLEPGLSNSALPRSDGDIISADESVRIVEAQSVERSTRRETTRVSSRTKPLPKKVGPVSAGFGGSSMAKLTETPKSPIPDRVVSRGSDETIGAEAAMAEAVVSTVVIVTSEEGEVGAPVATEVSTANDLGIKG